MTLVTLNQFAITLYEDQPFFQPISFILNAGQTAIMKGANGVGKSTILASLAGLGEYLKCTGKIDNLAKNIAYIGHKRGLIEQLTVFDNMKYYAKIGSGPLGYMAMPSAMQYFSLWDCADKKVAQLSAGWKMRVVLARLMLLPAELWLLDEPTTNLDEDGKALLYGLIESKTASGGAVIVATNEVLSMKCDMEISLKAIAS